MNGSIHRYLAGAGLSAVLAMGGVGLANAQSNDTTTDTGTTTGATADPAADSDMHGRGDGPGGGCDEDAVDVGDL